jgi:hypothetical protein
VSHQDEFTAAYLEALRGIYLRSENTSYVWMAMDWCLNEYPQHSLPDWCLDYLAKVAMEFTAMMEGQHQVETIDGVQITSVGSDGKSRRRSPPKPSKILHVLGFTSPGKHAFKDARGNHRAAAAAIRFYQMRKQGRSPSEALNELMDWLGEDDETNAKNILRTGERLLGAKSKSLRKV